MIFFSQPPDKHDGGLYSARQREIVIVTNQQQYAVANISHLSKKKKKKRGRNSRRSQVL